MEIRKCSQCGGSLKRQRVQRIWICPYCGAKYETEAQENAQAEAQGKTQENAQGKTAAPAAIYGLNEEVFSVEADLSKVMKDSGGAGVIRSIVHCMDTFENAGQTETYMLKKISFSDDISAEGVREEQIEKAMPTLNTVMESGERIIAYGNKGIFSKGKEYFVITDKRSIFVNKKKVEEVLHTDLESLKIEPCGNCYLNEDYDRGIINLDGNGKFQGALLALICMLSLEADPDRGRTRSL